MKPMNVLGACLVTLSLAVPAAAALPSTYQVTGPVVAVTDSVITVEKSTPKGKEKWEIARDKDTKVTGEIKVGGTVTVTYRMSATAVEVKPEKAPAKKK